MPSPRPRALFLPVRAGPTTPASLKHEGSIKSIEGDGNNSKSDNSNAKNNPPQCRGKAPGRFAILFPQPLTFFDMPCRYVIRPTIIPESKRIALKRHLLFLASMFDCLQISLEQSIFESGSQSTGPKLYSREARNSETVSLNWYGKP